MISRLISKLFLLSEYSDHNNDGQWGNDTNGLSGVDAGAPAEGDCAGSWQHLEVPRISVICNCKEHVIVLHVIVLKHSHHTCTHSTAQIAAGLATERMRARGIRAHGATRSTCKFCSSLRRQ